MSEGTRITKRAVEAVEPLPDRDAYLWDRDVAGFGVKVTPRGGRTYLFQYRNVMRVTRRVTIGRHGSTLTADQARKEALALAARVRLGEDPAEKRSTTRATPTFAEAVAEYLLDHAEARRKASTAREYRRLLELHAVPSLGRMKVDAIGPAEVAKLHQRLRETPYQANRLLAAVGSLFAWLIRGGRYRADNPASGIEKYQESKRERFLSPRELATLGAVLRDHEAAEPVAVAATRLLLLTGMRKTEALALRWAEVDLQHARLRLADSKTGAKTVPLSVPALEVIAQAVAFRRRDCPFVFPAPRAPWKPAKWTDDDGPTHPHLSHLPKLWERWRDEATVRLWQQSPELLPLIEGARLMDGAADHGLPTPDAVRSMAKAVGVDLPHGLDDVRIHDLRHSFASVGASAGDSLLILGSILGHADPKTTARYAHLQDDPRRAAAERIAAQINESLARRKP